MTVGSGLEPAPADPGIAAIAAEIKALRKGRGLRGNVAGRIGPVLTELATGTEGSADPAQVRKRLGDELHALSQQLPGELRTAVLAALALHPATQEMDTYDKRRAWLASRVIDRVPRTAERWIEEAQDLLAQEVAARLLERRGQAGATDGGWYIESFHAALLLDGAAPEALERRRIVATRPGLAEITILLDVPRDSGQRRLRLDPEVTAGGTLVRAEELSKARTRFLLALPRPIGPGDTHEYEMRIRVLPGEPMRDYYIFLPERRCDRFDLRVRFDRRRPPRWVRRVGGEQVRVYESFEGVPAAADQVRVDGTGEAAASFGRLSPHYGYGLQWDYPRQEAGPPATAPG